MQEYIEIINQRSTNFLIFILHVTLLDIRKQPHSQIPETECLDTLPIQI